jgi:hypothetical protein
MPSIPIYALSSKGESLSRLGSTFTYRFKTPLQIPSGVECTLSLYQASLWYVQPNISAALGNNSMQIKFGPTNKVVVFEDGLYSLGGLQDALKRKLLEMGLGLTGDEILLIPDNAQQKLIISVTPTTVSGDITLLFENDQFTIKTLLGYEQNQTEIVTVDNPRTLTGLSTAKFNEQVSYFLMNCSLSSGSYDSEGNYNSSQIAQMFPISIAPGSQLVHIPVNPIKCSTHCAGQTISSCTFSVTNQSGELQDMRGEEFSCLVVIEY